MTMRDYADAITRSRPGRSEVFWESVPLVGAVIAAALYRRRLEPFIRGINRVLKQRSEAEVNAAWQRSGCNHAAALRLIEMTRENIGWAKPRFLPEDPVWIIYWAWLDALDYEESLLTIQQNGGFAFTDAEWAEMENHTLAALVALVEAKTAAAQASSSSSAMS